MYTLSQVNLDCQKGCSVQARLFNSEVGLAFRVNRLEPRVAA